MARDYSTAIGIAIAVVAVALTLSYTYSNQAARVNSFTVNGRTYQITVTETNLQEWEKGLMNDTNVTNSTFALFVFPYSSNYSFWMKNTYAPLDIMWINNSRVVYLITAYPCEEYNASQESCPIYTPNSSADYVIEAHSGFAKANNITTGTRISLRVS